MLHNVYTPYDLARELRYALDRRRLCCNWPLTEWLKENNIVQPALPKERDSKEVVDNEMP